MKPIFFLFFSLVMTACQSETSREMKSSEKTSVTVAKKELNTTKAEKVEEKIIKDTKYYRISDHPSYLFPKLEIKDAAYEKYKEYPELEKFVEALQEDVKNRDWQSLKKKTGYYFPPGLSERLEEYEPGKVDEYDYEWFLGLLRLPMLKTHFYKHDKTTGYYLSFSPIWEFIKEYDAYQKERAKKIKSKYYRYKTQGDETVYITEKGAKVYEKPDINSKVLFTLARIYVVPDSRDCEDGKRDEFLQITTHDGRIGCVRHGSIYRDMEELYPEDKEIDLPIHIQIKTNGDGFTLW